MLIIHKTVEQVRWVVRLSFWRHLRCRLDLRYAENDMVLVQKWATPKTPVVPWFIVVYHDSSFLGGYSALLIILGQTCMKWYTANCSGYLWIVIVNGLHVQCAVLACLSSSSPAAVFRLWAPLSCKVFLAESLTLNQPLSPVHSHQQCFQFGIAHTDVMTKQRRCIGTFTTYGPWIGKQQDVAIEPHPDKNNRAVVKTIKCHYVPFTSSWPGFWFYIFLWLSMLLRDCPGFPWCSIVTTPTGNQTIIFDFVFLYYCSTMYMRCNWNSRL